MIEPHCVICEKNTGKYDRFFCPKHYKEYGLEPKAGWVKALIELERERRNEARSLYRLLKKYHIYEIANFDQEGDATFEDHLESGGQDFFTYLAETEPAYIDFEESPEWRYAKIDIYQWINSGALPPSEFHVLCAEEQGATQEGKLRIIENLEGMPITYTAYRQRLTKARQKLKKAFPHISASLRRPPYKRKSRAKAQP